MATEKLNDITGQIVDSCIKIHKKMGPGLYEKVYEDCLAHELECRKIDFKRQSPITVEYEALIIPNAFKIDLFVMDKVIVELKSTDKIHPIHETRVRTPNLKASTYPDWTRL